MVVISLARKRPALALGNVVGSAISNILGAFSLGLLFRSPSADMFDQSSKIYTCVLLIITTLAAGILAFGRRVNQKAVGGVFVGMFALYIVSISVLIARGVATAPEEMSDSDSDSDSDTSDDEESPLVRDSTADAAQGRNYNTVAASSGPALRTVPRRPRRLLHHVTMLLLGFLAICLSGFVLSTAASNLVDQSGMSDLVFGIVILSIATTLPEKAVAIVSGYKGHMGIMVANTVGSNIFLLTLCLGIVWLAEQDGGSLASSEIWVMFGSTIVLNLAVLLGGRFARPIGVAMLLGYIAFIVLEFTVIHGVAGAD